MALRGWSFDVLVAAAAVLGAGWKGASWMGDWQVMVSILVVCILRIAVLMMEL